MNPVFLAAVGVDDVFIGVLLPTLFLLLLLVEDILPKWLSVHALLPRQIDLLLAGVLRMEAHQQHSSSHAAGLRSYLPAHWP